MFRSLHLTTNNQCRKAFTLVELLVVIAIIGVLVALLLPAVQQAREAARRSSCSNQLKQLGLALHLYHDTYLKFPIGAGHDGSTYTSGSYTSQRSPWSVALLPYIEQTAIYERYNFAGASYSYSLEAGSAHADNRAVATTPMKAYTCPSYGGYNGLHTNYFGVMGGGVLETAYSATGSNLGRAMWENGILYRNSRVGMNGITDGTTNTLALGETIYQRAPLRDSSASQHYFTWASSIRMGQPPIPGTMAGVTDVPINGWKGDGGMDDTAFIASEANSRGTIRSGTSSTAAPAVNCLQCRAFSSRHPGGAQFCMASGSVQFLSDTIDLAILRRLAIRNDGEVIGEY
ncbi:MAG: DUF1559 domain-containing protein [Pirellulaceae bacterium]